MSEAADDGGNDEEQGEEQRESAKQLRSRPRPRVGQNMRKKVSRSLAVLLLEKQQEGERYHTHC